MHLWYKAMRQLSEEGISSTSQSQEVNNTCQEKGVDKQYGSEGENEKVYRRNNSKDDFNFVEFETIMREIAVQATAEITLVTRM